MEHPAAVTVKQEEVEDQVVVVLDAGGRAAPESLRTPPPASQVPPFLVKTFELVECRDPCLHRSHMWYNSNLRRLVHTFRQNESLPFI